MRRLAFIGGVLMIVLPLVAMVVSAIVALGVAPRIVLAVLGVVAWLSIGLSLIGWSAGETDDR